MRTSPKLFCGGIKSAQYQQNVKNNVDREKMTIRCSKCKAVEDTFEAEENPEDFGYTKIRNKWYCTPCVLELKNKKK